MRFRTFAASLIATSVAMVSSSAFGAAWVPPSGSNSAFSYAGGGDDYGLFGTPVDVSPEGFTFEPAKFLAKAFGGVTTVDSVTTDRMYVDITANGGAKSITQVKLSELGDYTINNGGGVKAYAYLQVRVLDANYGPTTIFYADDTFLKNSAGSDQGAWTLDPTVTLPAGANKIRIVLNNNLQANSATNGTALIVKKSNGTPDDPGLTIVLPEPVSMSAILGGLSLLGLRRRQA